MQKKQGRDRELASANGTATARLYHARRGKRGAQLELPIDPREIAVEAYFAKHSIARNPVLTAEILKRPVVSFLLRKRRNTSKAIDSFSSTIRTFYRHHPSLFPRGNSQHVIDQHYQFSHFHSASVLVFLSTVRTLRCS
jgi:hypothetical protein